METYYARLGLELTDYSRVARRYREHFDDDDIAFDLKTLPARVSCWLAGKRIPLQALLLSVFHGLGRRLRKALGFNYWPHVEANLQPGERPDSESILGRGEIEQSFGETGQSGNYRMARSGSNYYSNYQHLTHNRETLLGNLPL